MYDMKKVELLSPAGSYEGFLGALHAGADAVYLGGDRFGARAYAGNFSKEELLDAIRLAHIYGRKIYMTVNTLMKEDELKELPEYIEPFYEAGLDGVIIQDLGAFIRIGRCFPELKRHVSTQMTVTGAYGASYLKKLGAERIVPARELSLEEIRQIKKRAGIELETFIHGAVCYCYSGQCLFSSMVGGRSGNRGRCAQPCRLPYETKASGGSKHLLSLKDMCTAEILPELIGAGIDSFKIEGRMKSPEYAAGVTAVYRKYIDRYYESKEKGLCYKVESDDLEHLQKMYLRSETGKGYYHMYNGPEMITLHTPGYSGQDDTLNQSIREKYLEADGRIPVDGVISFHPGENIELTLNLDETKVQLQGDMAEKAKSQPLLEADIRRQMNKTKNSPFVFKKLDIIMSGEAFVPLSSLNRLRRLGFAKLEDALIRKNGFIINKDPAKPEAVEQDDYLSTAKIQTRLHVSVTKPEQLKAVCRDGLEEERANIERIYLSSDLLEENTAEEILKIVKKYNHSVSFFLSMPYILRLKDEAFLKKMKELLSTGLFSGLLVRNMEALEWTVENQIACPIVTDAGMYIWNHEAAKLFHLSGSELYLPFELNEREITAFKSKVTGIPVSMVIYGRIPMMVSANCVEKTTGNCKKVQGTFAVMIDRYKKKLPVYLSCSHCYNIIYNSVVMSLHNHVKKIGFMGLTAVRLDFTDEEGEKAAEVIRFYRSLLTPGMTPVEPPFLEYTNGHWKRGVQ